MAEHAASRQLQWARSHTKLRRIGFTLSVILSVVVLVIYGIWFVHNVPNMEDIRFGWSIVTLIVLSLETLGCLALVVFDYNVSTTTTRHVARATLVCLIASIVATFMTQGFQLYQIIFIYQFFCITAFQTLTDDLLSRNESFVAPWEISDDENRREYIPLNFFNIFWVFTIASIFGLCVEVVFRAITAGILESRAGLLWGPFSPLYGLGGVLMTVALNRYWNKSTLLIFVISGLIGAGLEWFASFFWEMVFGIKAWDYTGAIGSIDGRTDIFHAIAWGALGLMWIRILLPNLLRAVDSIPLRWRAAITTVFALFMLVNCTMTVVALECWYQRQVGNEPQGLIQEYCAEYYDDDFMQKRFETMTMKTERAQRIELPALPTSSFEADG